MSDSASGGPRPAKKAGGLFSGLSIKKKTVVSEVSTSEPAKPTSGENSLVGGVDLLDLTVGSGVDKPPKIETKEEEVKEIPKTFGFIRRKAGGTRGEEEAGGRSRGDSEVGGAEDSFINGSSRGGRMGSRSGVDPFVAQGDQGEGHTVRVHTGGQEGDSFQDDATILNIKNMIGQFLPSEDRGGQAIGGNEGEGEGEGEDIEERERIGEEIREGIRQSIEEKKNERGDESREDIAKKIEPDIVEDRGKEHKEDIAEVKKVKEVQKDLEKEAEKDIRKEIEHDVKKANEDDKKEGDRPSSQSIEHNDESIIEQLTSREGFLFERVVGRIDAGVWEERLRQALNAAATDAFNGGNKDSLRIKFEGQVQGLLEARVLIRERKLLEEEKSRAALDAARHRLADTLAAADQRLASAATGAAEAAEALRRREVADRAAVVEADAARRALVEEQVALTNEAADLERRLKACRCRLAEVENQISRADQDASVAAAAAAAANSGAKAAAEAAARRFAVAEAAQAEAAGRAASIASASAALDAEAHKIQARLEALAGLGAAFEAKGARLLAAAMEATEARRRVGEFEFALKSFEPREASLRSALYSLREQRTFLESEYSDTLRETASILSEESRLETAKLAAVRSRDFAAAGLAAAELKTARERLNRAAEEKNLLEAALSESKVAEPRAAAELAAFQATFAVPKKNFLLARVTLLHSRRRILELIDPVPDEIARKLAEEEKALEAEEKEFEEAQIALNRGVAAEGLDPKQKKEKLIELKTKAEGLQKDIDRQVEAEDFESAQKCQDFLSQIESEIESLLKEIEKDENEKSNEAVDDSKKEINDVNSKDSEDDNIKNEKQDSEKSEIKVDEITDLSEVKRDEDGKEIEEFEPKSDPEKPNVSEKAKKKKK